MRKKNDSPREQLHPPSPQRRPGSVGFADEPFSRPFLVDRLRGDATTEIAISADATERAALAERDGLDRIERLEGRFRITRQGDGVHVGGAVDADVVQTCVISLEPFPARISEPVDVRFAPEAEVATLEAAAARRGGDVFEDVADADDVPDPIVDGRIDLGALAAEFLTLGLDPHPRRPGVDFDAETNEDTTNVSPFAALRARSSKP